MTFDIAHAASLSKQSASKIANLSTAERRKLLTTVADLLLEKSEQIVSANKLDLAKAHELNLSPAMLDRLAISDKTVQDMANSVLEVCAQDEVLGSVSNMKPLPSGIQVGKKRIPLGVIAIIYESRPNVTIEAATLCLKAGNAVILRGGKEAQESNKALATILGEALTSCGLPAEVVTVIPDPDRAIMQQMLTLHESIDLVIPRGGEGLIKYVTENSRIPVIQHFKGVCHLFIDESADLNKAVALLENGKTQRTGVCNALETLLVHKNIASKFFELANELFVDKGVKVHACEESIAYFSDVTPATEDDWHAEYLALEIAVKQVDSFDHAVAHIEQYGSGHTEVIVTEQFVQSQRFLNEVNSSVVMVNASSRFSDGGQLGLGAEIGISTSKLHAYGPMGAESLTTEKFIVVGDGHVRA